jgi:hypothetical protein
MFSRFLDELKPEQLKELLTAMLAQSSWRAVRLAAASHAAGSSGADGVQRLQNPRDVPGVKPW